LLKVGGKYTNIVATSADIPFNSLRDRVCSAYLAQITGGIAGASLTTSAASKGMSSLEIFVFLLSHCW
jgi:hypothetical protein